MIVSDSFEHLVAGIDISQKNSVKLREGEIVEVALFLGEFIDLCFHLVGPELKILFLGFSVEGADLFQESFHQIVVIKNNKFYSNQYLVKNS